MKKDEKTKVESRLYTDDEIRRYQSFVEENKEKQKIFAESEDKLLEITKQVSKCRELLEKPAKRFIKLGWKTLWHGIFIGIGANPDSSELQELLKEGMEFWNARVNISRLCEEREIISQQHNKAQSELYDVQEKVRMYWKLFPGIESQKLSAETDENQES